MAGLGSTPSLILGVAAGGAASAAFEPALEIPKQGAWEKAPFRVLDPATLARLYAQGGIDLPTAHAVAAKSGHGPENVDALAYLAQTVPGGAEALHLWRLGEIDDALFIHTLVKEGLDQRYVAPIVAGKLKERLGLGDIAYAVVRGILPAPPYVPVAPPAQGDFVPRYPQLNIDPELLAAQIGYDPAMLELMVGRSGLSMAPGMAANAFFRGIIGPNDYLLAIAEGDLRTEWADPVLETSRQILTVAEYVEAHLRGWTDAPTMYANTAKHGTSQADTDLAFQIKGRPITIHQVTTGLARGGFYPAQYSDVPQPFRKALEESDIRPEWASLAYANRYSYPSAFVMRALAEAGDLGTVPQVAQLLEEIGWPPALAAKVAARWVPATTVATDPHVKKAQSSLFTEAHKAYVKNGITVAQVQPAFNALSIPAAAQTQIIALWDEEKVLAAL